ncbi:hypothetical protein [Bacillus sp. ISL-47]|nr:hypothetical protein [Bacillus sp. ISL-47]
MNKGTGEYMRSIEPYKYTSGTVVMFNCPPRNPPGTGEIKQS